MSFADFFWLIFLLSAIQPLIQQRVLLARRMQAVRHLEKRRGSRVITLIHRQESFSFFGLPFARYLDIDDSEEVLRAIELTDERIPIDLVLHTPGGLVLAAEQIAFALARHPARVTVMVPHYAMSGGTLLALAADEIRLAPSAVLGAVDPQVGQQPAVSILSVLERKHVNKIDDETLVLADMSRKAMTQIREAVVALLVGNGMEAEVADKLAARSPKADGPTTTRSRRTWPRALTYRCQRIYLMGSATSSASTPSLAAADPRWSTSRCPTASAAVAPAVSSPRDYSHHRALTHTPPCGGRPITVDITPCWANDAQRRG